MDRAAGRGRGRDCRVSLARRGRASRYGCNSSYVYNYIRLFQSFRLRFCGIAAMKRSDDVRGRSGGSWKVDEDVHVGCACGRGHMRSHYAWRLAVGGGARRGAGSERGVHEPACAGRAVGRGVDPFPLSALLASKIGSPQLEAEPGNTERLRAPSGVGDVHIPEPVSRALCTRITFATQRHSP